jgi:hypothetical protein
VPERGRPSTRLEDHGSLEKWRRAGLYVTMSKTQLFNVVFTGHVDHGKSSFIGQILADSGMITSKNLETIKKQSAAANAKFSYAYLIDRLMGAQKRKKQLIPPVVY